MTQRVILFHNDLSVNLFREHSCSLEIPIQNFRQQLGRSLRSSLDWDCDGIAQRICEFVALLAENVFLNLRELKFAKHFVVNSSRFKSLSERKTLCISAGLQKLVLLL